MPAPKPLVRALRTLAFLAAGHSLALTAWAQAIPLLPGEKNSQLDAPLFYQLLIGEMQARQGDAGTAHEVLLDAARRTRDEQLFKRATDIALEARAGDSALAAAQAWRQALPRSGEALRYLVQILIALNRSAETVEPMQALLAVTPDTERAGVIAALPRLFLRSGERKQAGPVLEKVLANAASAEATRVPALTALGRAWQIADDTPRALDYARRAHALDAAAEGPTLLALDLLPAMPEAEAVVTGHLQAKPESNGMRMAYARALAAAQRYPDAIAQLEAVTRNEPNVPQPYLSLGALHLELKHTAEAEAALKKFVELVRDAPSTVAGGDAEAPGSREEALTQAWLMLAQAAELRGDYPAAEAALGNIDSSQRALEVQARRAMLLARQGRVDQARELVRQAPERGPDDARAKLMAEAQILRELRRWDDALQVLAVANTRFPDDPDLLYEQSMMAEKLDRMDEMERLLRRVIEIKPDHHHAYNALGFSLADRNVRLPEAKVLIERALALMPDEPFITDSLGWVEYRLGNREEALRLLRKAYAARPDAEIGAHLGEVLWVTGAKDEARRIWGEAQQRDEKNDVLRETLARLRVDL
jgi:tetratricopeptide (TPR) repeat protein